MDRSVKSTNKAKTQAGKKRKLLWIDMEMTGLDIEKEVVIEIAAMVSDYEFDIEESYETVVQQPQEYLDRMDDWNRKHHAASGLTAKVPSGKPPRQVEDELIALVNRHWPNPEKKDDMPILAGNSVGQDRLFLNKYFPRLADKIHYRMLDVTSWKIIFNERYDLKYEKKNSHRALDDIKESIEELKFYLQCTQIDA